MTTGLIKSQQVAAVLWISCRLLCLMLGSLALFLCRVSQKMGVYSGYVRSDLHLQ